MVQTNKEYNQELIEKLINHFGIIESKNNGGYILPDGSLLNLNRTDKSIKQYHREVAALLPEEMQGICFGHFPLLSCKYRIYTPLI